MENILRIKEKIEEQKRMELGQAMALFQKELEEEERLIGRRNETITLFKEMQKGQLVVSEFQRLNRSLTYYEVVIKEQKVKVQKTKALVEVKRECLRKALEEHKIQEKLKEKAMEVFVEEEKLKEQNLLDEIVNFRYQSEDLNQ